MNILVAYDVATADAKGQRRLHKVALICQAFGQRVQNSVFECLVNETQYEQLKHRLTKTIDLEQDSLRIYRLREPKIEHVELIGRQPAYDITGSLIL
jgi:CRISPR-associated protein Cas2